MIKRAVLLVASAGVLAGCGVASGSSPKIDGGTKACAELAQFVQAQTGAPTLDTVHRLASIGQEAAQSRDAGMAEAGTQAAAAAKTAAAFWNDDRAFAVRQATAALDQLGDACRRP